MVLALGGFGGAHRLWGDWYRVMGGDQDRYCNYSPMIKTTHAFATPPHNPGRSACPRPDWSVGAPMAAPSALGGREDATGRAATPRRSPLALSRVDWTRPKMIVEIG